MKPVSTQITRLKQDKHKFLGRGEVSRGKRAEFIGRGDVACGTRAEFIGPGEIFRERRQLFGRL